MDLETLRRIVFEEDDPYRSPAKQRVGETTTIAVHDLAPGDLLHILTVKLERAHRASIHRAKILFDNESTKAKKTILEFLGSSSLVANFAQDKDRDGIIWVVLTEPVSIIH